MQGSQLCGCCFRGADLRSTGLQGSKYMNNCCTFLIYSLSGADFTDAEMYSADLSGATLNNCCFLRADMRQVNMAGIEVAPVCILLASMYNCYKLKDALLQAKSLANMTASVGNIPEELTKAGVIGCFFAYLLLI